MQSSSNEKNKKTQPNAELSATWQELLGKQGASESQTPIQHLQHPANPEVQQLADDPWSHLLSSQGMQAVDLQKMRLHQLLADDPDVEHALDIMREASDEQKKDRK